MLPEHKPNQAESSRNQFNFLIRLSSYNRIPIGPSMEGNSDDELSPIDDYLLFGVLRAALIRPSEGSFAAC